MSRRLYPINLWRLLAGYVGSGTVWKVYHYRRVSGMSILNKRTQTDARGSGEMASTSIAGDIASNLMESPRPGGESIVLARGGRARAGSLAANGWR